MARAIGSSPNLPLYCAGIPQRGHNIMKKPSVLLKCLPVLALLGLAACAETELVAHTAKQVDPSDREIGAYKVGQPYEIAGTWYYPKVDYSYTETGIASWYGPNFHGKRTANGEIFDQHAMTAAHRTLPMPSVVQVTNLENGRSIKVRINDRGPFKRGRIIDLSRRGAELLGFIREGTAKVRVEIIESESRQLAAAAQRGSDDAAPPAVPRVAVVAQELAPPGSGGRTGESAPPAPQSTLQTASRRSATAGVLPESEEQVTRLPVNPTDIFVQAGAFAQVHNANRLRARLSPLGNAQVAETLFEQRRLYRVRLGPLQTVEDADRLMEVLAANGFTDARVVVD